MSANLSMFQLVEQRHTVKLRWSEPWAACDSSGNKISADVEHQATVHHCINMQRLVAFNAGRQIRGNDEELLGDFMAVHWAVPI